MSDNVPTQDFEVAESITVETQCHRFYLSLEALERISHHDTVTSIDNATNTRLFMRHAAKVGGVPVRLPDVSENALRSVIFRRALHDHLLNVLEIGTQPPPMGFHKEPEDRTEAEIRELGEWYETNHMPNAVVNLLYSGGNLAGGSKSPGNEIELSHKIQKLYPTLHLLGGATDSFVLTRSALRVTAWPVAREFARAFERLWPDLLEEAQSSSIFDYLFEETRVRGTGAESSGNQTIYTYEVCASGLKVLVELTLDPWTPEPVLGAMFAAPQLWDGFFGGQGRQGAGRMSFDWLDSARGDAQPSPTAYVEHLQKHGEEMRAGLLDGTLGTGRPVCVVQ